MHTPEHRTPPSIPNIPGIYIVTSKNRFVVAFHLFHPNPNPMNELAQILLAESLIGEFKPTPSLLA
jgi:hypothetical protein